MSRKRCGGEAPTRKYRITLHASAYAGQPQVVRPPKGYADFGTLNQLDDILDCNPYLAVRHALAYAHEPYGGSFFLIQNETAMHLQPDMRGFLMRYLAKQKESDTHAET